MTPLDLAASLLMKARDDLRALRVLAQHAEVSDEVVGFHAQQAVEKAVKAVLTAAGVRAGRTHDLGRLIRLVRDAGTDVPEWIEGTFVFEPFAVTWRYAALEPDESLDRAEAESLVTRVLEWAAQKIPPMPAS
jgi:HEPN domain-containing protein